MAEKLFCTRSLEGVVFFGALSLAFLLFWSPVLSPGIYFILLALFVLAFIGVAGMYLAVALVDFETGGVGKS